MSSGTKRTAGLPNSRRTRPGNEWPEVRVDLHGLLEGDCEEESERPGGNALHERCVRADGDLECSLAGFAGCACAPEMGLDQGPAGEDQRRVRGLSA